MIYRKTIFITLLLLPMCLSAGYSQSSIVPVDLTCEYRTDPVGLDVPRPRLGWVLKAADDTRHGQRQSAYRIFVSHSRASMDKNTGDMWDSGWISSDEMQQIEYKGKPLQSDRTYFWKVAVKDEKGVASPFSKTAQWSTGLFTQEEWTARWIGASEVYDPAQGGNKMYDPWFRKSFNLKKKPARGTLFVASVGYHEVYVNGRKIDHPVLEPAVTDHTKRARYLAYDIAPALQPGKNVIGLWLGTSWSIYAPYVTSDKPRTPIVVAQADIYNTNGERMMRIATDESWKTHPSPNKLTGNWGFGVGGYGGEIWDANKEIKNWNTISLDDRDWKKAIVYHPRLTLSAQQVETNRLYEVPPAGVEKRSDGSYRVDMGVNFAGWVQIAVKGNPGDTVRFLFSEREQEEMTFGLQSAYVLDQSGKGVFRNRFNYGSGRWITIRGVSSAPALDDIEGWMIRTAFDDAATFECSDPLQNWIYNTVNWTFENLSLGGYVVDCPQRERFGYGGDAHATSETGMFNYKMGAFYTKWLEDWRDVQGTEPMTGNMNDTAWARKQAGSGRYFGNGVLPQSAPTYHGGGGPAWGGIVVTLPWLMYRHYGDTRVLEENFAMIGKWLDFLDSHTENNLLQRYGGSWDFLGDWLWPNATAEGMNNDKPETLCLNNCYRVYNLRTAAKIARVIGCTAEAEKWERQAEASAKAIHAAFYDSEDHSYADRSMANLAAALYGNVMPPELRRTVIDRLEKEILVNRNGHIHVGITAGAMLFKVLRDEGRDDLIYAMTSKTDYPGWGFMRDNGATTIWEMWEKDLPGHSLLHSSYLYPGAWYIDGVGGIRRDDAVPGFRKFIVRVPRPEDTALSWAKASFDSPSGTIRSHWTQENRGLRLSLTVPPNTAATVWIPTEEGAAVGEASGFAKEIARKNGYVLFEAPAGKYEFKIE